MVLKLRFYLWLVDELMKCPLTFSDIKRKWLTSFANIDKMPLYERTFNRYRRDAEVLMNIDIICDKSQGNVYKIKCPDDIKNNELHEWLLSAYRINSLAEWGKARKDILLEPAPPSSALLHLIMETINEKKSVKFKYKSHYEDDLVEVELIPAFVRLFKQRWYVIGEVKGKKRERVCALERISNLEIVNSKAHLCKEMEKLLNPSEFFRDCYGIIRQFEPVTIRIRAFWPQNSYIKDVPLHYSQRVVEESSDYTDFEIFVRPTYDLKQELLWHRDKVSVLSPEWFKEDMIGVLKATLRGYESGQNNAIDE